jgi:hypothetical protein
MINRFILSFLVFVFVTTVTFSQSTVKGYVVTLNRDTLRGDIAKVAKARDDKRLSFSEVTLINNEGKSTRYVPGEIIAYRKGEVSFRNFTDGDKHMFGEQLTSGRVWLYFYAGVDGSESRYFFKRDHDKDFLVMNADAPVPRKAGAIGQLDRSTQDGPDIPIMPDRDKAFKEYFSGYFKDCVKLSRKIIMDFYSRSDIKDIFVEYNAECK